MSIENPFNLAEPPSEGELRPQEADPKTEQRPEREPVLYEQALAAAQSLRVRNVPDPLNLEPEDRETQAVLDIIEDWESAAGLGPPGIGTVEKAKNIVRAAKIWLDAGYAEPDIFEDAMRRLVDEHATALREGNEEVTGILADAIADLEARTVSPEQKAIELRGRFEAGKRLMAEGNFTDAVGVFTGMLTDPYFKIHGTSAEGLRGEIEEALTAARAGYEKEQAPRRIAAAEIRADIDEAILLRDAAQYREACAALSRAQTRARAAKMRSLFDEAGDMIDVINQLE